MFGEEKIIVSSGSRSFMEQIRKKKEEFS